MTDFTPAQHRLIDQYRDFNTQDDWWDAEYSDFKEVAKAFGIPIDDMYFRLAYSQGDGACFHTERFTLADILKAGRDTVRDKTYGEVENYKGSVKAFYDVFQLVENRLGTFALVRECSAAMDDLSTRVTLSHSHYEHSGRMDLDEFEERDIENHEVPEAFKEAMTDIVEELCEALRECADALYNSLRDENEYQTEDEQVWDSLVANGLDSELEDEDDEPEDDETPDLPFTPPAKLEDWLPALQCA